MLDALSLLAGESNTAWQDALHSSESLSAGEACQSVLCALQFLPAREDKSMPRWP